MKAKMPPGMPHIPLPLPINRRSAGTQQVPAAAAARVLAEIDQCAIKDSITTLASELIDKMQGRGHCEFMKAVAEPMPVQVFLKMLGLPLERQEEYRTIVSQHLSDPSPDPRAMIPKLQRIAARMHDDVLERKRQPAGRHHQPAVEDRDRRQADHDRRHGELRVLLFIAGLDTVMNGIGHGVRHLAQDPELQDAAARQSETGRRKPRRSCCVATRSPFRRASWRQDIVFQGVRDEGGRARHAVPAGRRSRPQGVPRFRALTISIARTRRTSRSTPDRTAASVRTWRASSCR